jgi:hypothetical protein
MSRALEGAGDEALSSGKDFGMVDTRGDRAHPRKRIVMISSAGKPGFISTNPSSIMKRRPPE